jgi:hypothetical protein
MNIFQKAIQHFGTTSDFREVGYILPDGTMLDFSDKQNGGLPGMRLLDHREVAEILDLPQTEALIAFMNSGCIRVMPECPGLDISVYPTKKQMDIICRFADYYRGNVCIDISDERGNIVKTFEYPKKTSSSRIIFDIRTVFQQRKIFAESV